MKQMFSIAKNVEYRVWHRYMTNSYELLGNPSQTLQDAGLYIGQVYTERLNCCPYNNVSCLNYSWLSWRREIKMERGLVM